MIRFPALSDKESRFLTSCFPRESLKEVCIDVLQDIDYTAKGLIRDAIFLLNECLNGIFYIAEVNFCNPTLKEDCRA